MKGEELAEARAAFAREAGARRRLHNTVQELRGNIRVFVRVRPDAGAACGVLHAEDGHRVLATTVGATKARVLRAGGACTHAVPTCYGAALIGCLRCTAVHSCDFLQDLSKGTFFFIVLDATTVASQ